MTDIQIAQQAAPLPLGDIAAACGIDAMAEKALELIGGNIAVNPRTTTKADVLALYRKAL